MFATSRCTSPFARSLLACAVVVPVFAAAATPPPVPGRVTSPPPAADDDGVVRVSAPDRPNDPRFGVLTPLPERGAVPPIVSMLGDPDDAALAHRARVRQYERQLGLLKRRHFGTLRVEERRARGLELLQEFTDPASFRPMIDVLAREADDVRLTMLDHFAAQGDDGQAALAWVAIHDRDAAIRNEALRRMTSAPGKPVLRVLDQSLRSPDHAVANNAGLLAGSIGALEAIPLLMFSMINADPEATGDLAWIAIQTQRAFVAGLQPVVGDNSGAFVPIVGVVSEGIVLRVQDAVVVVYRTLIYDSLVNLTTYDYGESTAHMGYDMNAWWHWYNDEYVPFKNEQARLAAIEAADEAYDRDRAAGTPSMPGGGAPPAPGG